jgi:hypothetical protein
VVFQNAATVEIQMMEQLQLFSKQGSKHLKIGLGSQETSQAMMKQHQKMPFYKTTKLPESGEILQVFECCGGKDFPTL